MTTVPADAAAPDLCKNCQTAPVQYLGLCSACLAQSVVLTNAAGQQIIAYTPQPHQMPFHASNAPNLLALGTRDTGKSKQMRWDVLARCMRFPGFKALILRRKLPDLRKSHLRHIGAECKLLGCARYRESLFDVVFENNSFIQFSHCENTKDIENYLSSEWDYIGFDELSSFTLEMFLNISAACRTDPEKPYKGLVRAGSNPLGPGAAWMKAWFVDHVVDAGEYPDYFPDDFEVQFSTLYQNRFCDIKDYEKRLKNLPEHVRRAWLKGEFVIDGAYFTDFRRTDEEGRSWHTISVMPLWKGQRLDALPWVSVYRAVDWGYFPDPWVCLWIMVLPNKHAIVFREEHGRRMLAADVAKQIKRHSVGMHVVDTFCDPTMFVKDGAAPFSIGEIFEQNGVPLTAAQNDRQLYGYAIHEHLSEIIDGVPMGRIYEPGCPHLVRTLPLMQMDPADQRKIADGDDHWVVAWAYFCMSRSMPTPEPGVTLLRRWQVPKKRRR